MESIVVVGLGNPGEEYHNTRHNVGFLVIDELCRRFKKNLKSGEGDYLLAHARIGDRAAILVKPLTYMNNTGIAVAEVLERFNTPQQHALVVADDFALPLGTLRIRTKGSDGGHNGLYSVIYHLNTNKFPRVRCGIKKDVMPPKTEMADFVLSPFEDDEHERVKDMVGRAADAVTEFATSGIARTMNRFNTQ